MAKQPPTPASKAYYADPVAQTTPRSLEGSRTHRRGVADRSAIPERLRTSELSYYKDTQTTTPLADSGVPNAVVPVAAAPAPASEPKAASLFFNGAPVIQSSRPGPISAEFMSGNPVVSVSAVPERIMDPLTPLTELIQHVEPLADLAAPVEPPAPAAEKSALDRVASAIATASREAAGAEVETPAKKRRRKADTLAKELDGD